MNSKFGSQQNVKTLFGIGVVWIKKITLNGFESVVSQSSLGNAMEICSAIENDKGGMSNEFGEIQHEG